MRAIMLMFDSLKRNWLPPYGGDIIAPNFERLERRTVAFDNFYIGSMPCMPARRELHTGRYNFLHKGWSPLEPFDDSVPELLKNAGIHTHLVSDHHHYWRDGGANYHPRYSTYEHIRGQEGDFWKGETGAEWVNTAMSEEIPPFFRSMFTQDTVNRKHMRTEAEHCQTLCYDAGLEFLETNSGADNWFLNIECFDPHEPFFTCEPYQSLYKSDYLGRSVDWPQPRPWQDEDEEFAEHLQNRYKALVSQIDRNLGRVLDAMDKNDMWEDTMLIVNTDHGLLLGEHDWWSKGAMPPYNEIAQLPFFLWDPRCGSAGERRQALAQNIDVAATLLEFFGLPLPPDMQGRPLTPVLRNDEAIHQDVLFGYFGGNTCIADGRYVYMRGPVSPDNAPLCEYTLMPAKMGARASCGDFKDITLQPAFSFTKGCRTMKLDRSAENTPFSNMYRYGSRLYDLAVDPGQASPISDTATELALVRRMIERMKETDAPSEQYQRMGLWEGITEEDLAAQHKHFAESLRPDILTELVWSIPAANQMKTMAALLHDPNLTEQFRTFALENDLGKIEPKHIYAFAKDILPQEQAGMIMMMLRMNERLD